MHTYTNIVYSFRYYGKDAHSCTKTKIFIQLA